MATFVLVHGAWSGGWEWRSVATLLQAAGHTAYTPTLTGLGERVHLATPSVDLDTHIADVVNVLYYERLHNVTLVGHSYGGAVVTGVAERVPERLAQIIYVDAFVLEDGQAIASLIPPTLMSQVQQGVAALGDGWRVPHFPPDEQHTAHPLKTWTQPIHLTQPTVSRAPCTYLHCSEHERDLGESAVPLTQTAARIKADARWRYREMAAGHVPMRDLPHELTQVLIDLLVLS
jgi:pimeloyl-ACP methyl ester carboxylesterase